MGTADVNLVGMALRGMAKRALVRPEDIRGLRRYVMHNLVHDFARGLIVEAGKNVHDLSAKWLASTVHYANRYGLDSTDAHDHLELGIGNFIGAAAWAAETGQWVEVDQLAMALHESSGFILRRGNASQAVGLLRLGVEAARQLGDRAREGLQVGNLGSALFGISEYKQAIEHYRVALEIARELGDRINESRWTGALGLVYDSLGQFAEAIRCYEDAICIDRSIGNRRGEGKWLGSAAGSYRLTGNAALAVEYYEEAIRIARELNDRVNEGVHLSNLGNAHRTWGDYQQAIEYYNQAIEIARETGDKATEARAAINSARLFARLGQPEKGLEVCDAGLDLFTQIGFRSGQAYAHGYKGEIFRALHRNEEARTETELALGIHREIHALNGQADWLHNLGLWAAEDGDLEEGIRLLTEALRIRKELGIVKAEETKVVLTRFGSQATVDSAKSTS